MTASPPEVLFVCVHNAGRSQMAAAFLQHHAGERVIVRSAGSAPADDINPAVVTKLADRGSTQTVGIVTDVGLFLSTLARKLSEETQPS